VESEKLKATLYDFLYIDRERVKSLYAQLFGGLQTAVQQVELSSHTDKNSFEASAATLVKGGHEVAKTVSESRLENLDPHDLLLRDVLQRLAEDDRITNDPEKADAGQLVLLSGSVTLFDMEDILPLFDIYVDMVSMGKLPSPDWAGKEKGGERKRSFAMVKNFLGSYTLGLQLVFETESVPVWGTLNPGCLRENVSDLTLKHGPKLSGVWHMLAIVDVVSGSMASPTGLPDVLTGLAQAGVEMVKLIGKPANQRGVTPLLLFRKLA
jgi:hypothetical protein